MNLDQFGLSEITSFLRKIELFDDLDDDERKSLFALVTPQFYAAGDYLFRENQIRQYIYFVFKGEIAVLKTGAFGGKKTLVVFESHDFLGENILIDESAYSTAGRALTDAIVLQLDARRLKESPERYALILLKLTKRTAMVMARRLVDSTMRGANTGVQYVSGRMRKEHDLLGERDIVHEVYYGIQTQRALENFNISGVTLSFYPVLVDALVQVKKAAALANIDLGLIPESIGEAIVAACDEVLRGKFHRYFAVDMFQGGAGTSTNMNANEVIANRALQILGHDRGEYQFCHPNNHVNFSQSTNDAYPTAVHIALIRSNRRVVEGLAQLVDAFRKKGLQFAHILKMGRTQLQDAVPMTLGQEFEAYAATLEEEIDRLTENTNLFLDINLGATAIGTGINADPAYGAKATQYLGNITGLALRQAKNLIEATQDTSTFITYSSAIKRLAIKLSKICNDLRLLSSGPRAGLNEINLPPMQPGSSIMPGKVNPVIPELVNQIAFKVIGNDLTVSLAVEAGQLELNVMEPVIVQSILESIELLVNGMATLKNRCIDGITANEARCRAYVMNSIGLVTALVPVLGYETSTAVAKEALLSNRSVYEIVLEKGLLAKEEVDRILTPENMLGPTR